MITTKTPSEKATEMRAGIAEARSRTRGVGVVKSDRGVGTSGAGDAPCVGNAPGDGSGVGPEGEGPPCDGGDGVGGSVGNVGGLGVPLSGGGGGGSVGNGLGGEFGADVAGTEVGCGGAGVVVGTAGAFVGGFGFGLPNFWQRPALGSTHTSSGPQQTPPFKPGQHVEPCGQHVAPAVRY